MRKVEGKIMNESNHYTDLLKAHKFFKSIEGRWKFYDAYMENRDASAWLRSRDVPIVQGLLLFGFVHSWDPNYQGDLTKFFEIYKVIFPYMHKLRNENILTINFTPEVKDSIEIIFDEIAKCPREKRYESTDTSKLLHAIIPEFFVMWDDKIRKATIGEGKTGKDYSYDFLPRMQVMIKEYLKSYNNENGGDLQFASKMICQKADNKTLAKLIDEYNYVRFTKKKSLVEIRNIVL